MADLDKTPIVEGADIEASYVSDLYDALTRATRYDNVPLFPQQVVTVAKAGGDFTTIQAAINSITDAASNKIYTVLVYPGEYDEEITLKNGVDIVAVDPDNTKILRQVKDNGVAVNCYLEITIENQQTDASYGLYISAASTITIRGDITGGDAEEEAGAGVYMSGVGSITIIGDVTGGDDDYAAGGIGVWLNSAGTIAVTGNIVGGSSAGGNGANGIFNASSGTVIVIGNVTGGDGNSEGGTGALNNGAGSLVITGNVTGGAGDVGGMGVKNNSTGITTITGNISSGMGDSYEVYPIQSSGAGSLTVKNGTITTGETTSDGHVVYMGDGTLTLINCLLVATNVDAKSIYAVYPQNVTCIDVWANRNVDSNITQLTNNGFHLTDFTGDFIFGSPQMDDDGNADHDARIFFNKSKGSFRVGVATGGHWDDTNVGINSFACGVDNKATGNYGCYAEGNENFASGNYGCHAEGVENNASGSFGCHAEGNSTISSGQSAHSQGSSTQAIGRSSHAEGERSIARLISQHAHASGKFSTTGDCQNTKFQLRGLTTDNTITELILPERFTLEDEHSYACEITIHGRQDTGANHAMYKRMLIIERTGGTVALEGSVQTIGTDIESDADWDVSLTADDTNKSLKVEVTGDTGQNVRWTALIETIELGYSD